MSVVPKINVSYLKMVLTAQKKEHNTKTNIQEQKKNILFIEKLFYRHFLFRLTALCSV